MSNFELAQGVYMNGRRLPLGCVLVALILGGPSIAWAQQPSHPVLDAPGIQQDRVYSSEMPFEHIDTFTGSLVLTFPDLVLPGNAGRELRFQRTFNSKPLPGWSFGIAGIPRLGVSRLGAAAAASETTTLLTQANDDSGEPRSRRNE